MTTSVNAEPMVWRPYMDEPVLTPAMADGYDAVPAAELDRLRQYLDAVVVSRKGPVHAVVAFNAAYFGYDTKGEGYGGSPLDLDTFPVVVFGERTPALPVGAMVQIATGTDPLYAEIVYKEGEHPEVSTLGGVPEWVSGAPAGATGPGFQAPEATLLRRELLVPQLDVFGPALALRPAQLNRLRARARWIDQDGHVLVDACYPSSAAAEQDDVSAYADYLLTDARGQLLSPLVPVSLIELAGSREAEVLRGALYRLLDVIGRVLASSDALRLWGSYAITRTSIAACWKRGGPLGGDDMRSLVSALQHPTRPAGRRRHGMQTATTVYTAIGPRLRSIQGAEPLLTGVGYATAVCRANLAIADVIRGESDNGLFDDGTRVSLDDAFEHGGVWRSRNPGMDEMNYDPLVPLGLGWRGTAAPGPVMDSPLDLANKPQDEQGSQDSQEPEADLTSEPVDAPLQDGADLDVTQLLRVSDSEIVWRMPLRLAHIMDGFLPVRPVIADELREVGGQRLAVRLDLTHPGGELDDSEAVQDTVADFSGGRCRLTGLEWPLDFFPGLELHLQWPRGGRVIRATTTLLDIPVTVEGRTIEHRYDPTVLTREDAPGSARTNDSAAGLNPGQLVMRAVRRCGLLTQDGHALLDRTVLSTTVYGQGVAQPQAAALDASVDELLADGRLYAATGSRDDRGCPHYPARPGQAEIPLIGYTPNAVSAPRVTPPPVTAEQPWRATPVSLHYVHGFLRRLRPGHTPTDQQRSAYREHCRKLGKADGWDLPPGYTFVTQHTRGR